ncbi:LysR substrate-binding domain-containing protein [Rhodovulum sulfidophilum]|uniref:LysR substrate-binding domain-containing protein n=1 Tax=Rhodovulum sulfidophilum TaxID=35806 RepID=UPI00237A3679|nr:LysR substrate-binding domain-containing protein [Rhodovulum sulfidophilum]
MPNPKPITINPKDSRYERGTAGGQVSLCTDAGFVPQVTQEAHGMHAVLSLVAVGAGVSVVPESMKQFRPDQITYQPIAEAGADFPLSLALHKPGPATAAFTEIASYGRCCAIQAEA